MCDPISLIGMGLSAAGSLINASEQHSNLSNAINARNAATRRELERQKVFQQQSRSEFDQSAANFSPDAQRQSLADAQSGVASAFTNNAPAAVGGISTASAPRVVQDSEAARVNSSRERQAGLGAAMAKLAGYDQNFFGNNLKLNDRAREIDRIGDFAKTSAAVSGMEGRAAYNNAMRPPSGIGDLFSFVGGMGANYGGRGMGASMFNMPYRSPPLFSGMTGTGGLYG